MSGLYESLRHIFSVLDDFLNITLRNENLSKTAEKERSKVSALIKKLYLDYQDLNPNPSTSKRKSVVKDSKRRDSVSSAASSASSFSQQEPAVPESPKEIAPTTVKALINPIKIGFLQMKSLGSKQKPYCVLHNDILYWFSKPLDKQQEGAISVKGYEFKSDEKKIAKKNFTFTLVGPGLKPFQFVADNKEDLESWKHAFDAAHEFKENNSEYDDDGLTYFKESEVNLPRQLPPPPKENEGPVYENLNEPIYSCAETLDDEITYMNEINDEIENLYDTVGS